MQEYHSFMACTQIFYDKMGVECDTNLAKISKCLQEIHDKAVKKIQEIENNDRKEHGSLMRIKIV